VPERPLIFSGPKQEARLQELAAVFFGRGWRLAFDPPKPPPKSKEQPEADPPMPLDLATLKAHALEIFGGTWETRRVKEETE
jgi:hypothetical protein